MKDESTLLRAARKLDKDALTIIFDMYAPAIYSYALHFCHDPVDSDNVVGDVFAQLLKKLAARQGPPTNLRPYLYQLAYPLVVDQARRNKLKAPSRLTYGPLQTQAGKRALIDAFISILTNELNELQHHVIILRFLEDFSLSETAAIIGKKVNHVKVLQHRGIVKLRESLGFQSENIMQQFSVSDR
jgi:RNA polymerase sigma-70 factor (ECF subfamily)